MSMTPGEMEKLDMLEERLMRLISSYEALRAEIAALKEVLVAKDGEIELLSGKLKRLGKEKGAVKDKLEGLLGRLDGI